MQSLVPAPLPKFNPQLLSVTQLLLKSSSLRRSGKKPSSCWLELTGAGKPNEQLLPCGDFQREAPSELLRTAFHKCLQFLPALWKGSWL